MKLKDLDIIVTGTALGLTLGHAYVVIAVAPVSKAGVQDDRIIARATQRNRSFTGRCQIVIARAADQRGVVA